jgi:hypothetical protein
MNRILSDKLFRTIPNAPEQIQNIFRFNACLSPFVEITCIYTHTFDILFPFLPFAAKMKLAVLASVFVGAAAFAPNTVSNYPLPTKCRFYTIDLVSVRLHPNRLNPR